jgi:hypothetical protein
MLQVVRRLPARVEVKKKGDSMRQITSAAILTAMLLFTVFQGAASAEESGKYCSDQKLQSCNTSITDDDQIVVSCSWPFLSSFRTYNNGGPNPDPPAWETTQGSYRCEYETRNDVKTLVCKGFIGVLPDVKARFTDKEFLDAQTRCNRICGACKSGSWK